MSMGFGYAPLFGVICAESSQEEYPLDKKPRIGGWLLAITTSYSSLIFTAVMATTGKHIKRLGNAKSQSLVVF